MSCTRSLAAAVLALAVAAPAASASISVDASTRTVTTPRLTVTFDAINPEQITTLRWAGTGDGADLAADGGVSGCGDALESWGQSYADPAPFGQEAAAGSRGTWQNPGGATVQIASQVTADGCTGFQGQNPVQTTYGFTEGDQFVVTRRFGFDPGAPVTFTQHHLRPYVPRLPRSPYNHTLWPSDTGFNDSVATTCNISFCARGNWTGTWYAQHDPTAGRGLLVLRAPSPVPARLLVDNDTPSISNSSSADLIPTVFDGPITETEYLCFYTDATWPRAEREAGRPPSWCGASLSISDVQVSEAQGTATLFVRRSMIADPGPTFAVVAHDGSAKLGADYGPPTAAAFPPGSPTAQIRIPLIDNDVHDGDRSFTVSLTDVQGATAATGAGATVTIADDDPAPPPAPPATTSSAPPAAPPTTGAPRRPATTLRAAQLVTLPKTRSCRARRPPAYRIRLRQPEGTRIARTVVKLNGKVVKTVRGHAPITIAKLPRGAVTVSVAVRTTKGLVLTATRAYAACRG
jgi:hypothetical protein